MTRLSLWRLGFLLLIAGPAVYAASQVCAECHTKIYKSYQTTPMARSARKLDASAVPELFDRASFTHGPSAYRYRVSVNDKAYSLEFTNATGSVSAAKPMAYAVGSGTRAFGYLLEQEGFLYESPVAYYSANHTWGLAPGYDQYSYPYLTRPIAPGCLACHASSVQPQANTLNRYASPAFLEGGVGCERCHGDASRHVAKMKAGDLAGGPQILNPAKLTPDRRDSICAQCHLSGDVRVMRPRADWRSFVPGARLNDSQTVFVRAQSRDGIKVTGHVEDLSLSACKRLSGDKLWCASCHDPHVVPSPAEAAAWYQSRCLQCHATDACSEKPAVRALAKNDCVSCHMPKSAASDAQHVVLTDHSIPRRPRPAKASQPTAPVAALERFGGGTVSSRDLALGYAIAAVGKPNGPDRARAIPLLEKTARESHDDVEVLLYLAEIYRNDNKNDLAQPLYERAISLDPGQATAPVGLGGIMMERGNYAAAVRLWSDALSKNAGLELVRLNLSIALLKLGRRVEAEANLRKALDLNPAFAPARELLEQLTRPPAR